MDSLPNVTDIGVGVVLLVSALLAYARGFVHEVLAVGGWIGAIFATIYAFPYVSPFARDLIGWQLAADGTALAVVFIVSLVVLSVITRAISNRVQASMLNALDRSLGFLFGIVRGAVLVSLAYVGVEWAQPVSEQPPWLRSARSMPVIEAGARLLRSLIPDDDDAAATNDAREKVQRMLETEKAMRQMLSATPKGRDPGAPGGYGVQERRDMERLIDSSQ